ncbi:MAG: tRNA lysidine(34) synthetase TilS [Planctomycetota bacterium]|jgi:tRNA(Ile)-lysidine synthase
MLSNFENKVAGFVRANRLFGQEDRVLLAVSGGADSVALLHTMQVLKTEGFFNGQLQCAHINHRLRGAEADQDEEFVRVAAEELKLTIRTRRVDVRGFARKNKVSIETAGRELRIESLAGIAKANRYDCVATGHQKDDQAETVIQRLLRGTGYRGLGGIRPVREFGDGIRLVRPLLCVTREEIVEYLRSRDLEWRVDRTNYDCRYRRNFIRHRLLGELQKQCAGALVEELSRLARSARGFYDLVSGCAESLWPELTRCDNEKLLLDLWVFLTQPEPVQIELIRRALVEVGSGEKDLTQRHYERILALGRETIGGRQITLPNGFEVRREYDRLVFTRGGRRSRHDRVSASSVQIEVPGVTRFGGYLAKASILAADEVSFEEFIEEKNEFVEWFDLDRLKLPLLVRARRAGDRFVPFGLTNETKVGKFLTSAKVAYETRGKALVVADGEKVIWVWPVRMSQHAKVNGRTRKILELRITETNAESQRQDE